MKCLLDGILPKILPKGIDFLTIPHEGKGDLEKSIPLKLQAWNEPEEIRFVIVHDQDMCDCKELKAKLVKMCEGHGKKTLVRIACHELESWYLGDFPALEKVYGRQVGRQKNKSKFRNPDDIVNPKEELYKLCPKHQQILGAKMLSQYMDIENNKSVSFNIFIKGLLAFCR